MPILTKIEKSKEKYISSSGLSSTGQELHDNAGEIIDHPGEYANDKVDSIIALFMENESLSTKSGNDLEDKNVDNCNNSLNYKKARIEGSSNGTNFKDVRKTVANIKAQTSKIHETVQNLELNFTGCDINKQPTLLSSKNSDFNDQSDLGSLNDDSPDIQIRPLSALHTRDLTTNQEKNIHSSYPVTEPIDQPGESLFEQTELNENVSANMANDLQDNTGKRSNVSSHSSTWGDEKSLQRFSYESNKTLAFVNDTSTNALNTEYGKEAFITTPVVPYLNSSQMSTIRDVCGKDALSKRTSIKNWRFGDIDGLERSSSLNSLKSGNSTLRNDKFQAYNNSDSADKFTERKRSVSFRIPEPFGEKNSNNIPLVSDNLNLRTRNSNLSKYFFYGFISSILAICFLILSLKAFDIQKQPIATEDDFVSYFNNSSNSTKIRLVSNFIESYGLQNFFTSQNKKEIMERKSKFVPRHNNNTLLESQESFTGINFKYSDDDEIKRLLENDHLRPMFSCMAYAPAGVIEPHCNASQRNVLLDIARLSTITRRVRTYGTQCKQAEFILEAIKELKVNMTLSLGVWIGADTVINKIQMQEMKDLLLKYPKEYFYSIYIGNEVIFRGDISVNRLMEYVKETKSYLRNIGYADIPVGTSELGSQIKEEMLRECDFIGANIHPFFGGVEAEYGTKWTLDFYYHQLIPMRDNLNLTTNIIISEVGWPYDGGQYLMAVSGPVQYQKFLNDWLCTAPVEILKDCVYFESYDEPWKKIWWDENKKWETEWGFFTSDRQVKKNIYLPDCSKYTQSSKMVGALREERIDSLTD